MINKIIILLCLSTISYGGDFYYSFGKKISLTPLVQENTISRDNNKNIRYFLKHNKKLGVDGSILVKFIVQDKAIRNNIIKKYNLIKEEEIDNNLWLVRVKDIDDTLSITNKLYNLKEVQYSHPNFSQEIQSRSLLLPNDPLFGNAHHLKKNNLDDKNPNLNIAKIFTITKGNNVKIGLIDDGLYVNHEDLKGNIAKYADILNINRKPDLYLFENEKHGTNMTGIIASIENNKGSIGIAPQSKIYLAKHNNERGITASKITDFITGFKWLEKQGVKVINNSWGTYDVEEALKEEIDYISLKARGGKGIVVVFACGNSAYNLDEEEYNDESEIPSVLGVGTVTKDGKELTYYSNYGKNIDLFTIGDDIITTSLKDTYIKSSGTSPSAAIVSGVIGLMFSINPELSVKEVKDILYKSSTIEVTEEDYTFPVLNAYRALELTLQKQTKSQIENQILLNKNMKIFGTFSYFDFKDKADHLDFILVHKDNFYQLFGQNANDDNIMGLLKIKPKKDLQKRFYIVNRFGVDSINATQWLIIDSKTFNVYLLKSDKKVLRYMKLNLQATIYLDGLVEVKRK
jgi:hypothetical protein